MSISDETLMQAYVAGDENAFAELYARYELRLFRFFERRLFGNRKSSASDLFQKTWLKLHQGRASYDSNRKFSAWIYAIALNVLRDFLKQPSEQILAERVDETEFEAELESLEEKILARHELNKVEKVLARIPASQKEAILLSEWEGMSSKEVGDVFGITELAARQLIFRARRNVKGMLAKE